MATTTTNFGWDIPQSTDLVKDGATAIAALGQDIDTAFVDFKGGTTGQVLKKTSGTDLDVEWGTASSGLTLINTTSFSGVSSQSISDVFSTTYTNYRIVINVQSATSQVEFLYRMRVSGSDDSTSNYYSQVITGNDTSVAGERVSTATSGTLAQITNNQSGIDAVFYKPFEASRTMVTAASANSIDTIRIRNIGSVLATSTSYTGLTLICSQNITGTISIYGLAK
jgi:hypothetical protein